MTWGFPLVRCPACGAVRKPTLTPGDSPHTLTATCPECHTFIKHMERLGEPVRQEGEPAPVAGEASSGPRLYAKSDLARAALQELARRKLLAMGLDPDAPRPDKHGDE